MSSPKHTYPIDCPGAPACLHCPLCRCQTPTGLCCQSCVAQALRRGYETVEAFMEAVGVGYRSSCSVRGCGKIIHGQGLCHSHYESALRKRAKEVA